jgi:hypothetical protein
MTWPIQIQQTLGRIGLQYIPAKFEIHTKPADVDIHYVPPDLEIRTVPAQLTIDQTEAFEQEGRMKPLDFAIAQSQEAKRAALAGIERTAQIGDQVARAATKSQAIDLWATQNAFRVPELVPALVPSPFSVHIHYEIGRVEEHVQLGHVDERVQIHRPEIEFRPGAVKAYMEQQASLIIIPPSDHIYVV